MHWGDTFTRGSEHLVDNKPYAAVLDLRMGTSSITVNTPEHLYDYITQKD